MILKEILINKVDNHFLEISKIINTSEWGAKEIISGNGTLNLKQLQDLFDYLGLEIKETNKKVKFELSTDNITKTFKNYSYYWLERKKFEVRESTYNNYINVLMNTILPCLGDVPCDQFNNNLIQMFAYWCKEHGGCRKKGVSEHYIRDCVILIKSIVRYGQEENVFPKFSFKQIKIPKSEYIENKKVYTENECKKILKYIYENISHKNIGILLGIFTGMRIGEVCALKYSDIDF